MERRHNMILRNSVKGTDGKNGHSVSLGRVHELQAGPGRHQATADKFKCTVVLEDCMKNKNKNSFSTNSNNSVDLGNGSDKHIHKCGSKRCQFQNKFVPISKIQSTTTKRVYECIVPPGTIYINCHSSNIIYLVTCCKCGLQYVGETCQKLNKRFNWHMSCFKNPQKYSYCRILNSHFTEGHCKGAKYTVSILEKMEGTGRTDRDTMDFSAKADRKKREKYWMLTLRTVFPYGLNDRIGDEFKTGNTSTAIGKKFPPLSRNFSRVGRGSSRKGTPDLQPQSFCSEFSSMLDNDIKNVPNFIRTSLSSLKKSSLRIIHDMLNTELNYLPSNFQFSQYYLLALDVIESKIYKDPPTKQKKKAPENVCKIFFINKGVELINIARILHDKSLNKFLPSANCFPTPLITYKLSNSVSSKIFNYNDFVSSLDVDSFLNNPNSIPCECENSPFADTHHQHIITGDLRIVQNTKLRKILSRGPKFREKVGINFNKAKNSIMEGLSSYVEKWSDKNGIDRRIMREWESNVSSLIDKRIIDIEKTFSKQIPSNNINNPEIANSLENLQKKFIIAPIDKATGNVAIICKRFYASVLLKELGLVANNSSKTYEIITDKNSDQVIKQNISDLKNKFKISDISLDDYCLPKMYWLPKLHKNPIKARFIVAAPKGSIKSLSKNVTSAFKLFYKQIEAYNQKSQFFSGVNTFWVIQNNKPVTKTIKKLNRRHKALSISTFDFSTLYTKIPHKKLVNVLHSLIDFCFDGGENKYIGVSKYGAKWVKDTSKYKSYFDKQGIKKAVSYLLDNCFFTVGTKLLRQVIGIPMGSDPAPFFANLFLYHYERKWMLQLKRKDIHRARKFGNVFRFIDDLNAMNDSGEFAANFRSIYPPELELSKENKSDNRASFLDLDISLNGGTFEVGLFDKRDAFPFSIVRMPYKDSNIPSSIFYSAIGAEVLRIARVSTNSYKFMNSVSPLITRMGKQGAKVCRIKSTLKKFFNKHQPEFSCIANTFDELCNILNLN